MSEPGELRGRPIRATVLAATALVGLLPIVVFSLLIVFGLTSPLRAAFEGELRGSANLAADQVSLMRTQRVAELEFWTQLDFMQEVVTDDADGRIATFLSRATRLEGGFASLTVHALDGGPVARSSDHARPVAKDLLAPALAGRATSHFGMSTEGHGELMFAVPIRSQGADRAVIGVLSGTISEAPFVAILGQIAGSTGQGSAALLAPDGTVLLRVGDPGDLRVVTGLSRTDPSEPDRWTVSVSRPEENVFAVVTRLNVTLALAALAVALSVLGLSLVASRRISLPIVALTDALVAIRADASGARAPVGGDREIAQLGQALNELVSRLSTARQTIERHAVGLEVEVKARTIELASKNAELVEAAKFKSRFFAMMSHELRTPLHGIIGFAELTLLSHDAVLTAEGKENLRLCISSAEALVAIVTNLLDMTKLEAGATKVRTTRFSIESLAHECAGIARAGLVLKKDVTVSVQVDGVGEVETDALLVRQIMTNLLGNAVKFTAAGSVQLRISRAGTGFRIEVEDTGPGIAEHEVARMFEEFAQADAPGTRQHSGTGLGLAVVKRFVALLGGEVGVASKVGVGSTFWVTLSAS